LGRGGFGFVSVAKLNGEECVVKEFEQPQLLSLERTSAPNEAIGSYLAPKDDPSYLSNKVNIAQPSLYLVSVFKEGSQEDKMVDPYTMRSLVQDLDTKVVCHGLVMPKAKGEEVKSLLSTGKLTDPSEKKQVIKSRLQSIKGLNERGFVHRDLKPDNAYFDGNTGTTTLIDTGSLFKAPKDKEQQKHPQYIGGDSKFGTPAYMHPPRPQR
jgi:serine/threonine protein kinase